MSDLSVCGVSLVFRDLFCLFGCRLVIGGGHFDSDVRSHKHTHAFVARSFKVVRNGRGRETKRKLQVQFLRVSFFSCNSRAIFLPNFLLYLLTHSCSSSSHDFFWFVLNVRYFFNLSFDMHKIVLTLTSSACVCVCVLLLVFLRGIKNDNFLSV